MILSKRELKRIIKNGLKSWVVFVKKHPQLHCGVIKVVHRLRLNNIALSVYCRIKSGVSVTVSRDIPLSPRARQIHAALLHAIEQRHKGDR